jgi:hypothetical protein
MLRSKPARKRTLMKYICLGYYDKTRFDSMTEAERNANQPNADNPGSLERLSGMNQAL